MLRARNNVEGLPSLSLKTLHLSTHLKLSFWDWEECESFKVYVGLFAATCAWVRNYFRPCLSISACAIGVQHSNENSTTIFIDMIAPKGPRAMRKLTRFFSRDHRNTHGYWAEYLFYLHACNRPVLRSCPDRSLQNPLFCPTHLPSATETLILLHFFACVEIIFAHILVSPRVP